MPVVRSDQIRQLAGMRGLMAKPQKAGAEGGQIIENPILANFKEGLSVLEYFISTHGARKGLADTALKTADAGYLTRRLVDVAHDVIINEEDCGTLRGLVCTAVKKNDEVVASLGERIIGRVSVYDIVHPITGEVIVPAGEEITDAAADIIDASPIESVEIRSGPHLRKQARRFAPSATDATCRTLRMVQKGEAVGVIAAQSIGEPGTQLTPRTFHVGGVATNISAASKLVSKYNGRLEIEEPRTVEGENGVKIVVGRLAEMRIVDHNTGLQLMSAQIAYGSKLFMNDGDDVKPGDEICEWDPFNNVIISEKAGKINYVDLIENVTFRNDSEGHSMTEDRVIIESRDRQHVPSMQVVGEDGEILATYSLPVGAHLIFKEGDEIKVGDTFRKDHPLHTRRRRYHRRSSPCHRTLRGCNPSNPAIVSEVDGQVNFGKVKRGNRGNHCHAQVRRSQEVSRAAVEADSLCRRTTSLGAGTPSPTVLSLPPTFSQHHGSDSRSGVHRQRSTGRIPYAGCEDQRQALRSHRASDDAQSQDSRRRRYKLPRRADCRQA